MTFFPPLLPPIAETANEVELLPPALVPFPDEEVEFELLGVKNDPAVVLMRFKCPIPAKIEESVIVCELVKAR